MIPVKRTSQVNCKANIEQVEETLPVLFEPDELAVYDTFSVVERGSTSKVKIDVVHTANYDIVLRKHTILDSL